MYPCGPVSGYSIGKRVDEDGKYDVLEVELPRAHGLFPDVPSLHLG